MLRLGTNLSDKFVRRELRVLYGQTQAYPYAAQLDSSFDRTLGAAAGSLAITGAKGAIFPGLVAVKMVGENVTVSDTWDNERAFGLFADYVGGELGGNFPSDWTQIGVWRGVGSVYELLAPAFVDTDLDDGAAEDGTGDLEVYLNSGSKGQLTGDAGAYVGTAGANTARLINHLSANAIVVELLV